jgi:hypothetical protein
MRPADKAAIAAWFALMAVAPPSLCRTLAREMYVPTARPRALVAVMRFLGLAKKPEADRADLPLSRSEGAA